jgi:hypothetical protein
MPIIFGNNIPLPTTILNELFPIQMKGSPQRLTIPGVPQIEKEYHVAMEEGRKLEKSLGDAMHQIELKKLDIQEKIQHYLDLNTLAVDGQFPLTPRSIKYAADSSHFLQTVHKYTQDILDLIQALQTAISLLLTIEKSTFIFIQSSINALGNLLGEICNWGIPNLASIPQLFNGAGASIWNWNGVAFLPLNPLQIGNTLIAAFNPPNITIPTFQFQQCEALINNLTSIFNTNAKPAQVNQGTVTVGTSFFIPPLGGMVGDPTQFTNPTYIAALQANVTLPVYNPQTFNPNTSLIGSLPDPNTIISAYQLPPDVYAANAISLNPNLANLVTPAGGTTTPQQTTLLRTGLIRFVNLDQIVASNYDPNLTALWLIYLGLNRVGRGGQWLTNLQAAYTELVQPSLTALAANAVPYNNVLTGPGVVNTPTVPLITTLLNASPAVRENMLWQLSYIEAGLLGYTRSTNYDSGADTTFLSTFTGSSTDYVATTFDATNTVPVALGESTAQYPTVANVPKALLGVFNQAVAIATTNIAGAPNYQTNLARFKFVYNPFAVAVEVDRFTQFWRTFNYNFQQLLAGDSYTTAQIVTYVQALDSAIDPLGNPAIFMEIQQDANSRNRSWVPGTPLPNIPTAPVVLFQNPNIPLNNTGWNGTTFNPADFLARPDIQALPIPVQTAMLRTNLSYSTILTVQANLQNAIATMINTANTSISNFNVAGWHVLVASPDVIGANSSVPVVFQTTDYDFTGNVTSPSLITVQTAGTYALSGKIQWGGTSTGSRTINLVLNGTTVLFTNSTSNIAPGSVTQTFSTIAQLNQGDTLQVVVINQTGGVQSITAPSEFYGSLVPDGYISPATTGPNINTPLMQFIADATMPAGTAIQVDSNGNVLPVDPIGPLSPPALPLVNGVVLDAVNTGNLANVGLTYGSEYSIAGANFVVGGLVYAGPAGTLTQDYNALITEVNWVVVVGKAISSNVLLFQPQLPLRTLDEF